jgi:ankyrin repeat protein
MDHLVHTVLSAAEQGHKQRLATLLRDNPEMAETCDEEGSTPLMYAAANGRENVLYLLVQVRPGMNNLGLV